MTDNLLDDVIANNLIEIDRNGYILCPNHDDQHPSCKVNEDFVYCFTCGWSADAAGLEAKLTNREVGDVLRQWSGNQAAWKKPSKITPRVPKYKQRLTMFGDWVAWSQQKVDEVTHHLPAYYHECAKEQVWDIYDTVLEAWKDAVPYELEQLILWSRRQVESWASHWMRIR